jgi:hypothetical protein
VIGECLSWRAGCLPAGVVVILLTACGPSEMPPTGQPSITGVITSAERVSGGNDVIARIVVEENPAESAGSAKASVRLTRHTRIVAHERVSTESNPLDALVTGARVSVWFTGPVAESYPVQATADVVVLEHGA